MRSVAMESGIKLSVMMVILPVVMAVAVSAPLSKGGVVLMAPLCKNQNASSIFPKKVFLLVKVL